MDKQLQVVMARIVMMRDVLKTAWAAIAREFGITPARAKVLYERAKGMPAPLDMSVVRVLNKNPDYTLADLGKMTDKELSRLPECGARALYAIREAMMKVIVVTRHPALREYLLAEGAIPEGAQCIEHATEDDVRGMHVIGVLPLSLAALAAKVTEVRLDLPRELRGDELTLEQVRQYFGGLHTYKVVKEG